MSATRPPPEQSVRAVLALCSPPATLERLQAKRSLRLQRIYEVIASDGNPLTLVLDPPSMLRLLRSEQWMIKSEAAVVGWIRETLHKEDRGTRTENTPSAEDPGGSQHSTEGQKLPVHTPEPPSHLSDLAPYLPVLIRHSPTAKELGSAYSIFRPSLGSPIAFLEPSLSSSERQTVDVEIGRLFRRLSRLTSPSGRFGPVAAVLSGAASSPHTANPGIMTSGGASTWSVAFHSILESVLRDGEDMAVTLPYSAIRKQFFRLQYQLDFVETPRLVVLDGSQDSNVLVARTADLATLVTDTKQQGRRIPRTTIDADAHSSGGDDDDSNDTDDDETTDREVSDKNVIEEAEKEQAGGGAEHSEDLGGEIGRAISVTGLQDWSGCVFGDPLLAWAFNNDPSLDFLRGFSDSYRETPLSELGLESRLIEDGEGAPARLLLYRVYHTVSSVVKEFYRPEAGSSERELAARRRLKRLLTSLNELEDDPKRRHRRPTSDMSPAKKPRPDDGVNERAHTP